MLNKSLQKHFEKRSIKLLFYSMGETCKRVTYFFILLFAFFTDEPPTYVVERSMFICEFELAFPWWLKLPAKTLATCLYQGCNEMELCSSDSILLSYQFDIVDSRGRILSFLDNTREITKLRVQRSSRKISL